MNINFQSRFSAQWNTPLVYVARETNRYTKSTTKYVHEVFWEKWWNRPISWFFSYLYLCHRLVHRSDFGWFWRM